MSTHSPEQKSGSAESSPILARVIIVGVVFAMVAYYLSDLFTR